MSSVTSQLIHTHSTFVSLLFFFYNFTACSLHSSTDTSAVRERRGMAWAGAEAGWRTVQNGGGTGWVRWRACWWGGGLAVSPWPRHARADRRPRLSRKKQVPAPTWRSSLVYVRNLKHVYRAGQVMHCRAKANPSSYQQAFLQKELEPLLPPNPHPRGSTFPYSSSPHWVAVGRTPAPWPRPLHINKTMMYMSSRQMRMRQKLTKSSCILCLACGLTSMVEALRMAERVMCCTFSMLAVGGLAGLERRERGPVETGG